MSSELPGWAVETVRGTAAALHASSSDLVTVAPARRTVRRLEATDRCVVLGSTQPLSTVDAGRAGAAGIAVARRSSGGAAVLVGPGESLWLDVIVPMGDRLWDADVGRAGWWLGDLWAGALRRAGVGEVRPWRGPLVRSRWSERICFAGLGPGEVTAGGRKVVGLAQRRTRVAALFQCALLIEWRPADVLGVLDLPATERSAGEVELAGAAVGLGRDVADAALRAFVAGVKEH